MRKVSLLFRGTQIKTQLVNKYKLGCFTSNN